MQKIDLPNETVTDTITILLHKFQHSLTAVAQQSSSEIENTPHLY